MRNIKDVLKVICALALLVLSNSVTAQATIGKGKLKNKRHHLALGRRPDIQAKDSAVLAQYKGCSVLQNRKLKSDDFTVQMLQFCSDSLKDYYGNNFNEAKDRIQVLPAILRDFIALTRTAAGEVHPLMPQTDHLAVMKTLSNRAKLCRVKIPECDTWTVAVEPQQFSMYNESIHSKNPVLFQSSQGPHHRAAIRAYIAFQNADFSTAWDSITHYHLASKKPGWATHYRRQPASILRIDGVLVKSSGDHHLFYDGHYKYRVRGEKTAGMSRFLSIND